MWSLPEFGLQPGRTDGSGSSKVGPSPRLRQSRALGLGANLAWHSVLNDSPVVDVNELLVRKGVVVQIDNNIPANKLGRCPVSFAAVAVYEAVEDANGNSVVCKAQTEDLGTAVSDDNDG